MFEEVGCPEVLGHLFVKTGDDLVNGFLPAWLSIFAGLNGFEELAHGLRYHVDELRRNLWR
jgi:hypothetical protein